MVSIVRSRRQCGADLALTFGIATIGMVPFRAE